MTMKKTIKIEGMSCSHCQARIERALNSIDGVVAKVDLKKGQATVRLDAVVSDVDLTRAIEEAGYTVTAIAESKGLFR
jgi:copper ion binding protein